MFQNAKGSLKILITAKRNPMLITLPDSIYIRIMKRGFPGVKQFLSKKRQKLAKEIDLQ